MVADTFEEIDYMHPGMSVGANAAWRVSSPEGSFTRLHMDGSVVDQWKREFSSERWMIMKITNIETFAVDAGWWPWLYVKVETDEGVTGYGECSEPRSPHGVLGTIADMKPLLMGKDPRQYEMRFWDMLRGTRQSPGGIAAKAIAGVELALLDIKAKALGISVVELFGGPMRDTVRLYWSHCGTYRARNPETLGTPPLRTMNDIADLGREVVRRGYTALKTNIASEGRAPRTRLLLPPCSDTSKTSSGPSEMLLARTLTSAWTSTSTSSPKAACASRRCWSSSTCYG